MSNTNTLNASEPETFYAGSASNLPIARIRNRNVKVEMSGDFDPVKEIDKFEEAQGIRKPKDASKNLKTKTYLFDLGRADDKENLEKLMNDPKFQIVHWKDTFTHNGEFRAFCIYTEDLDYKEEKK